MFLDDKFSYGGWNGPSCQACKQPILASDHIERVEFQNDPDGMKGLTGDYHLACSRPFISLANVINFNPWAGW